MKKKFYIICKDHDGKRKYCSESFTSNDENSAWIKFAFWDEEEHWKEVSEALTNEDFIEAIKDRSKYHGWYCVEYLIEQERKLA